MKPKKIHLTSRDTIKTPEWVTKAPINSLPIANLSLTSPLNSSRGCRKTYFKFGKSSQAELPGPNK